MRPLGFGNQYINPEAISHFNKTGTEQVRVVFVDGSAVVLDIELRSFILAIDEDERGSSRNRYTGHGI